MNLTERDVEQMADAILRGDPVRLGASAPDVQDAAEVAVGRIRGDGDRLRAAMLPILSAYRSTEAVITQEQITAAWAAYDALGPERRDTA